MMFQRPSPQRPAQYNPLAPQPYVNQFIPPNLPQQSVPSVPLPQLGQRSSAPLPKKINTQTTPQFQGALKRQAGRASVQPIQAQPGDPPKNIDESFPAYNARVLRHRDGYTPPPSRANLDPRSPSDIPAPSPVPARNYFLEGAVEQSIGQDAANAQSPILQAAPRQPNYIDMTNTDPLGNSNLMEPALPRRIPVSPGVNEGLLNRLPSRSDQGRSMMTPGGMVSGEALDSMHFRDMAQEQMETAQRIEGMINQTGTQNLHPSFRTPNVYAHDNRGFTRTVETDPAATKMVDGKRVSAYGDVKVVGDPMSASKDQLAENAARRRSRAAGTAYTDPETGKVTDYGMLNANREKFLQREQNREDLSDRNREIKTRAAQIQAANSGRIGQAIIDPSRGIAGRQHVGSQGLYGNFGRGAAISMARQELDKEERTSDALQTVKAQQQFNNRIAAVSGMQDGPEKDAVLRQINDDVLQPSNGLNEHDKKYAKVDKQAEEGQYRKVPGRQAETLSQESAENRHQMGLQIFDFLNDNELSDQEKKDAILRDYPELETEQGIDAFVGGTRHDSSILGGSNLNDRLRGIMGLPTEEEKEAQRIDVFGPDPTNMYGF